MEVGYCIILLKCHVANVQTNYYLDRWHSEIKLIFEQQCTNHCIVSLKNEHSFKGWERTARSEAV